MDWYKLLWGSLYIPCFSFIAWIAILNRLTTKDETNQEEQEYNVPLVQALSKQKSLVLYSCSLWISQGSWRLGHSVPIGKKILIGEFFSPLYLSLLGMHTSITYGVKGTEEYIIAALCLCRVLLKLLFFSVGSVSNSK